MSPDQSRKGRSWEPIQDIVRGLRDMSWPEACLKILRRLHVSVTPEELVDSYKTHKQERNVSDEDYIIQMDERSNGLWSVLSRKDALLYAASNLREPRVRKRLEKMVKSDHITTFDELFNNVVELNEDYVGTVHEPSPALKQEVSKHNVNLVGHGGDDQSFCGDSHYATSEHTCDAQYCVNWYEENRTQSPACY